MRRLFVLTSLLIVIALILVLIIQRVGVARADPTSIAAILQRDSRLIDNMWCWRYICPTRTEMKPAQEILRAMGMVFAGVRSTRLSWHASDDPRWHIELVPHYSLEQVRLIYLFPDEPTLTIGDMILIYGQPTTVYTSQASSDYVPWYFTLVCFTGDLCFQVSDALGVPLSPHLPISFFAFYEDFYTDTSSLSTMLGWRGFVSYHPIAP